MRTPRGGADPTFETELAIAAALPGPGPHVVVGLDEVGRGALAGPVTVGACAVAVHEGRVITPIPAGVRDSKLLSPARREALAPEIHGAAHGTALGWAEAAEIDRVGIMEALALAALRAIAGLETMPHVILLDGNVDVLRGRLSAPAGRAVPRVHTRVGADRACRSVAAASVVAKVARDAHMELLDAESPDYGWASNKGYGAAAHRAALARLGPHAQHRRSWNLGCPPGPGGPGDAAGAPAVLWGVERDPRDGDATAGEDAR